MLCLLSFPPLHSWLAAGCSATQTASCDVCFPNEALWGLQIIFKFPSLHLLSSLCPSALSSHQAWLKFVTVGWLFGGAVQGSGWDALISARLPIPDAAGATCQICDQDDYRCLATAAQAGSAHTQPCLSLQAVTVSPSLRCGQHCSPMEGLVPCSSIHPRMWQR